MVAAKRQQKLLLGLLCVCCSQAAADSATGQSLLRTEEGALRQSRAAGVDEDAGVAAVAAWLTSREPAASSGGSGGRLLRHPAEVAGSGLLPEPQEPPVGVLRYSGIEVPDWSHGIHDSPQDKPKEDGSSSRQQRPQLQFSGPIPPMGAWVPVSFSNYGKRHPMGPLLIACSLKPPKKATCEVLHDGSRSSRNVALYRAWSMWGDRSKGQAYVSLLSGSISGATLHGASQEQTLSCCENTNNEEGCVACTGLPSTSYNPLNVDPNYKQLESTGASDEANKKAPGPPHRYPISQSADPVRPEELFEILPNLKKQLGDDADPANLPCQPSEPPSSNLPTLGDIFRSRKDLTLVESMVKTSHIQQLIPCEMTFVAVSDDNARDFQGQKPPACLAEALNRPENQREMLKLVGRSAMLGRKETLPISSSVPLLYGEPAKSALWGDKPTWNNIQLTGEKIVYDRGVIHLLSRNDMSDSESRELLRRIVYWSCLHDHLVHHPALTRFALIMVDNGRSLPVIGAPPGPRPDWVARGNSGWFNPPKAKSVGDEDSERKEKRDEADRPKPEEEREDANETPKPEEDDAEAKQKPEEEADRPKPKEAEKPEEEADKEKDDAATKQEKPEDEAEKEKDDAGAQQKPEDEEERPKPKEAEKEKPEEEAEKEKDEAAAQHKPEEEERPEPKQAEKPEDDAAAKEAEKPKPDEEKPEARQRPEEEEKEADKPKPHEAHKPESEEKEAAAKQQHEKEEAEKRRPRPEEAEHRPKPDEEKEAAAKRQHDEEEAEKRKPKPEEEAAAAKPKPEEEEAAPKQQPEEKAEKPKPDEEKEAEGRQHEEEEKKRRPKPEEADKPEEGESAPRQKPEEERKEEPKPEEEAKEADKPEEEEHEKKR